MDNQLKCQSLFAFNSFYLKEIFKDVKFPWEILPKLKSIIEAIISTGLAGYTLINSGILVGKGVRIAESVKMEGPLIIGDGSEIRQGAYLRGSVILGEGCVIGNSSEVKNSILMNRVQAPHFNYIGDSILGEGAHLGAGAICSNLRSDKRGIVIKDTDFNIDTKLRKLGAILGDDTEIGCGAVLCPGTVIGKNSTVYPLTLARGVYPRDSIVKNNGEIVAKKA